MIRFLLLSMVLFVLPLPLQAGQRTTLYLDAGLVERDVRSTAGMAEILLPAAVDLTSLRIVPAAGAAILEVERFPARPAKQQQKELANLEERLKQGQDRLRALAAKEEIYRGAAKSQSGKAPRKTKANPEPLSAIRQGTDLAISQLESVLRQQRRTTEEIEAVTKDLERLRRQSNVGGTHVRIRSDRRDALLRVRYLQTDLSWQPAASLRFNGEAGELVLTGGLPLLPAGTTVAIVPAETGAESAVSRTVAGRPQFSFPVDLLQEEAIAGFFPAFRYRFSTTFPPSHLPELVSCYRSGEYLGTAPLIKSAESAELEVICGQ